ncbi:YdcF family protein [Bowmanella dokdonensis]|uniref:YdcF family protein n=1 Tax=Bowmanella dokdonensis TaxID=751969 RepID=A0A939ITB6_9ALTE|nr:YdcF family protein [Bowmanella dokdonensis]MBN7827296.1 YdcF family protein [Bowmanella dokdonensis]
MELFNSLGHFAAHPLNIFFTLVLYAFLAHHMFKHSRHAVKVATGATLFLIWCSLPLSSNWMLSTLEYRHRSPEPDSPLWNEVDALVVLGCQHYELRGLPFSDQWHSCSLRRNLQAFYLYQHSKNVEIYLTGGLMAGRHLSEASANQLFFEKLHVPPAKLHPLKTGNNTALEAEAIAFYLKGQTIALVTSASHQTRALRYLQGYDLKVIPVPVDHLSHQESKLGFPDSASLARSERFFYEMLAITKQNLVALYNQLKE